MARAAGPRRPAAPDPLRGALEEHTLDSAALRAPRGVTVYRPPGVQGRLPGCVLADGASVPGFAGVLEHAILSGAVRPVVLVGVHNAADPARLWPDLRAQEYMPGFNRPRFAAHLRFVTDEVIPWAASRFGVAERPWVASGFSNGAVWAIATAQRRPDVFAAVAAFSLGVAPGQIRREEARVARVACWPSSRGRRCVPADDTPPGPAAPAVCGSGLRSSFSLRTAG